MFPEAAISTNLQVAGTAIAAMAAVASWVAVVQARRTAKESRAEAAELRRPLLLLTVDDYQGSFGEPLGVSLHNAGGGVAKAVLVYLVCGSALARSELSFLRPGEQATFRTDIELRQQPDGAVVAAESFDGHYMLWNERGDHVDYWGDDSRPVTLPDMWAAFGRGGNPNRRGSYMPRVD